MTQNPDMQGAAGWLLTGGIEQAPIRGELFSVDRLEQHALSLASTQHASILAVRDGRVPARLLDNETVLQAAYITICDATSDKLVMSPAADWLMDNFHLVEERIRVIRSDLPSALHRRLPRMRDGAFTHQPRVLALAWEFVAHTDSSFDPLVFTQFMRAYQRVQPLLIAELWAMAVALQVMLVENLRRLAREIIRDLDAVHAANVLADRLLGVGGIQAQPVPALLSAIHLPLLPAFAVQLVRRLHDDAPSVSPTLQWLDASLAAQGSNRETVVREDHQCQGAANISIRNIIVSLRLMSSIDWQKLFDEISVVDAILRDGSNFAELDLPTRQLYRSAIEQLARGSAHSEVEVAKLALQEAGRDYGDIGAAMTARRHEPGYYLITRGRVDFERVIGYRRTFTGWLTKANTAIGISGYLAAIGLLSLAIIAWVLHWSTQSGFGWSVWLLAVLAIIPASDAAIAVVNLIATHRSDAKALPGLELLQGVPQSLRTMVVMPTLLMAPESIREQVKRLEVHHLANSDGDITFALLSDWVDCDTETAPDDAALLECAAAEIAALNLRHGAGLAGDRFLLLHRNRLWNAQQRRWIGWERKRGKLHEFNRLLRGATDTGFASVGTAPLLVPPDVRYVIVVDGDTLLPRGAAVRLIGKMAHPLNHPVLDPILGRVVEGHAVLQPRVSPALPTGNNGSVYQRVFASASGMDPYAFAVSDVYQDLFGEGSYCGKGIYDVDAFEAALAGRIPDNTLLSHDLLEGIFARAGLASDIEIIDEFPSRYDVAASRHYRWARGDWQLLPWILGCDGHCEMMQQRRAIPLIGRWKMIDNLRRSLSAPSAFLALLAGWVLPAVAGGRWTGFILATLALPAIIPFVLSILPPRLGLSMRMHALAVLAGLQLALVQTLLLVAFLADQAWMMSDAIMRTLFRLLVSRSNLLDWTTAAQAKSLPQSELLGFYGRMQGGIRLALATGLLLMWRVSEENWSLATPILALWLLAPAIARWISLPRATRQQAAMTLADALALRQIARRTWSFFEAFVTPSDNMLPPDNFQEDPMPVVAHRTSPTNLGLYLLSVVAAADFGWIGIVEAARRLDETLASMGQMERHLGHFYNWYGTQDRRALEPKYISSVDSGNLAGHLVALWNACADMQARPLLGSAWPAGIGDTLALVSACLSESGSHVGRTERQSLIWLLTDVPSAPAAQIARLREVGVQAGSLRIVLEKLPQTQNATVEAIRWARILEATIAGHLICADTLLGWAEKEAVPRSVMPSLAELPALCTAALADLDTQSGTAYAERTALIEAFERSAAAAAALTGQLEAVARMAREFFDAMSFTFLFDPKRDLLSIGYQVSDGTLDSNYYDLLASEARLASFVAIAKGDLPTRHWFRLGRAMAPVGNGAALISWSGSMFEYLMPSLVLRAPSGSLLEQTGQEIVRQQIKFGASRQVPWGVSESAYNARDLELTYQYSSFGIPAVGLKRGLGAETVIAPYATALAAMVAPHEAAQNFAMLTARGGRGRYGWYEALDFTRTRLPESGKGKGQPVAVIRAYMAHHQAMSIIAIADTVLAGAMRERFHNEPMIQATELLLQERMPREVATFSPTMEYLTPVADTSAGAISTPRQITSPHSFHPATQLMSNGRYAVMLTAAGSGSSRWRELAVTRWKEDATCDQWGSYVFLRDLYTGLIWSAGYQPTGVEAKSYTAAFSEGRAEINRRDGDITTMLEVAISSEDDAEVRQVSVSNHSNQTRTIELTSYAEIVLAPAADDAAHPAFSKLFVQTEFIPQLGALVASRRLRTPSDEAVWVAHLAVVEGDSVGSLQYETDRARFLGRGRTLRAPAALDGRALSGSVGPVLDPIFSLRAQVRIKPHATARVAFWTLVASSRPALLDLIDRHRHATAFDRAVTLAWTQAQVQLRHLGIGFDDAELFQRLANRIIYPDLTLRPTPEQIARNSGAASQLWQLGISGDLPILLLQVDHATDVPLVRQVLLAFDYWKMKQLQVDLVIINQQRSSYVQPLQDTLLALVGNDHARQKTAGQAGSGAVFLLQTDSVTPENHQLLQASARVMLLGYRGSLAEQLARVPPPPPRSPPTSPRRPPPLLPPPTERPALEFDNDIGGFSAEGHEYVVILDDHHTTPAPWINVIANRDFGFHSSAEGSGMTWSSNSQQNLLTPWSNDPVSDAAGEVIYLRDDDSGDIWTATAQPIRVAGAEYQARFGQGYTIFTHSSHGVALTLLQTVPLADSVKISRLTLTNLTTRPRRISVFCYVEWVLGASRTASAAHIVTEIDPQTGAMLARNRWGDDFGERVAFIDLAGAQHSWTADRREFLGRNGTLDHPAALTGSAGLSKAVGAGLDPCAALQTSFNIAPNASQVATVLLGQAENEDAARALIETYRHTDLDTVLQSVRQFWEDTLGGVAVRTPDRAMDILLNRWLLYQTLACRVWARAGFYQASGAYGFRDQLQDSMALCVACPAEARAHLLRAAARQFVEGDVQHWWLPKSGRGVRTRVSDDRIWLPFVVAHYVATTGDIAVLDEMVPFLEGPVLRPGESDQYFEPTVSSQQATLFEHCARALDQSLATGVHGLPLIGSGDWNDGLNRVGVEGRGESVWLAWFLHATLTRFAPLSDARNGQPRATVWRTHATALATALEGEGWDGAWYRRAFYDDGTPLGTAADSECRIDSIPQSWSVFSGAGDPARARAGMAAMEQELVRRDDALMLLFTPPFENPTHDPGYIQGYPPGIRENGGQYTHAATWSVMATAMLGDGDKAHEFFTLLNPINHSATPEAAERYRVEPYVVCADVYSVAPYVGRGGWTWYTGSAGWMYRAGLESILGFQLQGTGLRIDPCIPKAWSGFTISFRYHAARYEITVENPHNVCRGVSLIELDGVALEDEAALIPLVQASGIHQVRVVLG